MKFKIKCFKHLHKILNKNLKFKMDSYNNNSKNKALCIYQNKILNNIIKYQWIIKNLLLKKIE